MKLKLTSLLFGLLLAVGWTSNASAQSVVKPKSYYDGLTYSWSNPMTGESGTDVPSTETATDPYQMYELLRFVYMDKRFPGPFYSAYTANNVRERQVYYGGIEGGWQIPAGTAVPGPVGDITITTTRVGLIFDYVYLSNITVYDSNNEVLTSWDAATNGNTLPTGWTRSNDFTKVNGENAYYMATGTGTITIPANLLNGSTQVRVVINARRSGTTLFGDSPELEVNGESTTFTNNNFANHTWNLTGTPSTSGTYKPNEEGYTVLLVSVKNNTVVGPKQYNQYDANNWMNIFTTKEEVIEYLTNNVESIQLLTDGLRIGEGLSAGTVFNCTGTYNKFFFLGKGQAREKSDEVLALQEQYGLMGERVPFKEMFEEFSPTGGSEGDEIKDFYIEMMDGKVYDVVHDCASVIDNAHQFSMSGNAGTDAYAMSGMNFFVPDYRLKYWVDAEYLIHYVNGNTAGPFSVDGRIMNPYRDINGRVLVNGMNVPSFMVNYAQYNKDYAPKVGLYTIHLDAEAEPTNTEHVYQVTLDWTSSLDEMSGGTVPQEYTVFIVLTDSVGNQQLDTLTVTGNTHYDYTVPQHEHSYTLTYQVKGTPVDNDHPGFIAWSNMDAVVIPGWNDFLSLALEHYESDFDVPKVTNWYRNFLAIDNENEDNALTTNRIDNGESEYTLWRYDFNNPGPKTKVATLNFEVKNNGKTVNYSVAYENQQIEPVPSADNSKYTRHEMGLEDNGTLSVKGNGDIVIQPSSYDVNFYSITVTADNTSLTWNANQTIESRGWEVTNGSFMAKDPGTDYYYLEGGGYIRIPASLLNGNTNVNVVIKASRDAGKTCWITVNEDRQVLTNVDATNYTWNNVNTTSATRALNDYYVKVTSTDDLEMGAKYLIVCENNNVAFNGSLTTLDVGNNVITDVVANDGKIEATNALNAATFTITSYSSTQYYIQSASGYYIGYTGGDTGLSTNQSTGNTYRNYITFNNGNVQIGGNNNNATNRRYLRFNSNQGTNNYRFRYYATTTGQNIQLYKLVPAVNGMVRLGNLPIIDQFNVQIPATNDHPVRYAYVLRYESPDTTILSSVAEVPIQHTGAEIEGYYSLDEMNNDTDPDDFLTADVISAEVDMMLSPTSAPYYYTVNSKKNGVPADAWSNYLSRLQRRSAGDYQEMLSASDGVNNPNLGELYPAGEYDLLDYRDIVAESKSDSLSYVPIVWTTGIERRYYVEDSLHNSYGAPIWEVRTGDVNLTSTIERQASSNGGWNPSVNWEVDGTAYSLYFVEVTAAGILPVSNVMYEPYMFRIWLHDETESLRNYTWATNDNNVPLRIVDDGPLAGKWHMLAEYMCEDGEDLVYQKDITSNYANNLQFAGPIDENFKPEIVARFYYKVKGSTTPTPSTLRAGQNENDHVGYVVLKAVNPNIATAVHELNITGEVVSTTYYNAQGMQSDKPFDGVNIVVTRYSDGTTSVSKVVR